MTDFIAPLVDFTDFDRRRDALSRRPCQNDDHLTTLADNVYNRLD